MSASWVNKLKRTASFGPICHEVTPFVFKDRLYRVENHPKFLQVSGAGPTEHFHEDETCIRDCETGEIISRVLPNHYFGEGFLWEERLYIVAADYGVDLPWRHHKRLDMVSSVDLVNWTDPQTIWESQGDELLFNTAFCHDGKRFIMLYETNDSRWPIFTFKFCESTDLIHWQLIPDALYGTDKYVGGPALYYSDGWYYVTYVNATPEGYDTRITRSRDLLTWQDAPADRPVLAIAPTHRPDPDHPDVYELSASDLEICAWEGKTLAYFHSGDQQGVAGLEAAEYPGTPDAFLAHYFV